MLLTISTNNHKNNSCSCCRSICKCRSFSWKCPEREGQWRVRLYRHLFFYSLRSIGQETSILNFRTLFDTFCGLDKNMYMLNVQIQAIGADGHLTSTDIGSTVPNLREVILWTIRWITFGTTNNVYLHVPFDSSVVVGTIVQMFWGCDEYLYVLSRQIQQLNNFWVPTHPHRIIL